MGHNLRILSRRGYGLGRAIEIFVHTRQPQLITANRRQPAYHFPDNSASPPKLATVKIEVAHDALGKEVVLRAGIDTVKRLKGLVQAAVESIGLCQLCS